MVHDVFVFFCVDKCMCERVARRGAPALVWSVYLRLKYYVNVDFCPTTFLGALEISLKPREKVFESLVCKLISLLTKLIRTTFELI